MTHSPKHSLKFKGWPLWGVILLGLVIIGAGLGLRSPWPADEPRFLLIAKDMLANGHWLFPHRVGEFYPDKPPVFFWALAASLWITQGANKVAHLLPALCSGLVSLALVYDLSRRLYNRRIATFASLLLLFCIQFTVEMRASQIDGFLFLWTTLGFYGLCRHLLLGPSWNWYAIAGLAMGIGIITKGVGFLPLFILIPYLFMKYLGQWRHLPQGRGNPWLWALMPITLLIGVSLWLVPMLYTVMHSADPALITYRNNILFKQTVKRYADPWHHYHPFWYYLANIPFLWFPLSSLFPWLIPAWTKQTRRQNARIILPLAWALLVLVFFSLSHGKRSVYMMPALPGIILASAPFLPVLFNRRAVQYTVFACHLLIGILLTAFILYASIVTPDKAHALTNNLPGINPWPPLIALAGVFLITALWARPRRGVLGLGIALTGLWLIHGFWMAPLINPVLSGQQLMAKVNKNMPADGQLGMTLWKGRFVLYAQHPVTQFGYHTPTRQQVEDSAAWLRQAPSKRRVLTNRNGIKPCFDINKATFLIHAHSEDWYLLSANALLLHPPDGCMWQAPHESWSVMPLPTN